MKRLTRILVVLVCIYSSSCFAQKRISDAQMDSILPGKWKGESICQIKNSPCNSEVVVYYINKTGHGVYKLSMNKIVDNIEEEMGSLEFLYDPSDSSIYSKQPSNNSE